ncbi:chloramphenicol-sensitive protein RarD [Sphingomonas kyeonggiensis]|uniref:Chloramphenicol-sensitive protein RarD n=1 Tax=Sphingomonas kyeonggiensis TaxID=1268553 RepID=A0A7W7JZ40_9SPHN|nr:EamA family transporter RarD [Sphingomonas kyeonggiensis]MBB4837672.1 chloramphenicol-sensitive protein RarD [Sphingomonas kyeonggiensis]
MSTSPVSADPARASANRGLALAVGAYGIWGFLPIYFHILSNVPALQILAHRIVWSVLLLGVLVFAFGRAGDIWRAARGRTLLLLCASAALIAINWFVYIWSVETGHVLEASLGYFINPLVNVALGMLVLGERLRRWQGVAIGIAAAGVLVMALEGGGAILISLALALSFGFYGLVRKVVAIDSLGGLTVETILLIPFAAVWLAYTAGQGTSGFGVSTSQNALLVAAGVITATPLLMFAAAARLLPLSMMGLLQYIAPTLQFFVALALGEPLRTVHLVAFPLIWAGCALYAWDSIRAARAPVPAEG